MGLTYTMGSMTAGYQITKVDYEAKATADQDATHMGISLAVNENFSVSAGRQSIEIDNTTEDEVNSGLSASYTMGSITIAGGLNSVDSAGGSAGSDAEAAMLNLAFAF